MDSSVKTILVVDDDKPLLDALKKELKSAGYNVLTALDGNIGYEQALVGKPDLVLLDILMPNLDGLEMLKKLRAYDAAYCVSVPVIILSNIDSEEIVKKATKLKCNDFLVKADTSLSKILEVIKDKLDKKT
jgi:DNA-binding response OmpR family regulator